MHWYRNIYFLKLPWVYSVDQPPLPAGSYFIGPKASLAITWGGSKVLLGDYIFSSLHLTKESRVTSLTQTKVMRVRSNTFGDPLIQKISQNELSSPIISVLCNYVKRCKYQTLKSVFYVKNHPNLSDFFFN